MATIWIDLPAIETLADGGAVMILGCLIVGLACGTLAALSVILSGLGLWLALLAYSGIGALGLCLAVGIGLALQKPDAEDTIVGLA